MHKTKSILTTAINVEREEGAPLLLRILFFQFYIFQTILYCSICGLTRYVKARLDARQGA